jgi:hypothetical protein
LQLVAFQPQPDKRAQATKVVRQGHQVVGHGIQDLGSQQKRLSVLSM